MTLETFSEGTASDITLCRRVSDVLQRHYPDYPWMVGMHEASTGVMVIDLPHDFKPPSLRRYAYLFHIADVEDDRKVMRAGGEWLERIGLARKKAQEWAAERARENGMDLQGAVMRSRH